MNRAARARHDSLASWRRDLELRAAGSVDRAGLLVRAYAAVLERQVSPPLRLRKASDLPASKEEVAAAIRTVARFSRTKDPSDAKAMETLAARYMMLGEFVADEEARYEISVETARHAGGNDSARAPLLRQLDDARERSSVECARRKTEFAAFLAEPSNGPANAP
jgi:hypothetical protein